MLFSTLFILCINIANLSFPFKISRFINPSIKFCRANVCLPRLFPGLDYFNTNISNTSESNHFLVPKTITDLTNSKRFVYESSILGLIIGFPWEAKSLDKSFDDPLYKKAIFNPPSDDFWYTK